ncbi:hypothetical protein Pelo_4669 [Pelomyxa schiedti]|nr:hypothetical protein Pelo_4669 [Pelomyxa schiedti]
MVMTRSPSRLVLVSSRPEKIGQNFFQSFCCLGGSSGTKHGKSAATTTVAGASGSAQTDWRVPPSVGGPLGKSSDTTIQVAEQPEVLCWFIEPFTRHKIKEYVEKYSTFGGSQGKRSADLFNQHKELLKGVEELLRTPFILTMFMEILPTLVDQMEQDRSRKRFDDSSNSGNSAPALSMELSTNLTRLELYDRFVEQWFQRQKSKITPERMAQCTQHLTDDVEEVKFNFQVGGDIIEDFRSFSENLAIFMFTKGATALQYSPVWTLNSQGVEVIDQNNPLERFFSPTNRSTQLVLSGCPVQKKGANTFMFLHKSLQEYFIAYKIYKEIQLCSSMPFSNFPQVKCRETIKFMQSNYRETAHEIVSAIVEEISEKVQWLPAVEGHDEYTKFFETMMGPTDNVSEPADDPFYGVKMIFKQHKDALLLMAHPPPLVLAEVSIHDHKMEYMPQFACDWATQGMSYCWACDCCQAVRESWNPDANGWYCYKCDFKICKDCFLEYRVLPPSTSTPSESNSATPIVGTTSGDEETAVAKQQIPPESTSSGKAATSSTVTATNTDDSASTAATSDQQQEENFKRLREILAKILSAIGGRQRLDKWMKKIKEAHSHPEAQKGSSIDKEKVIADILEEMSSSRTTEVSSVKEACESVLSRTLKPEMHLEEEVDYTVTKNNFRPSLSVVIDLRRRLRKMQAAKEQGRRTKVVKYPKELLINQYTLVKVNDVIRFLLEMMRRDDAVEDAFSLRKALLLLVENSKWTNRSNGNNKARLDRADRAASTAMMLLIQGKQNFSNVDLRCIHINSADLSSGIFGGADLVRADFSDCKMGQVWLCGADLRNCNMTGVSFNERVAFDFGVGLACVDVTVDGTRLCACPRNKGHPLLCDVNDEDLEFKEVGPEVKCDQCKFSPDGKKICLVVHEEHHQSVLVLDIPSNTCVNVDLPKSMELKKGSASSKTGISSALCGSSAAVIKSICFSSDSTVLTISKEVEERSATFIFSLPAPASPDGSVKETTTAVTESAQAGVVVLPQHVLDGCFAHFFIGSSLLLTTNKSPPFWGVPGELSSTPPPLKDTPTNIGSGISMFAVSPTRNKLAGFSKQTGKVTVWEFSEKDLHSFHMLFEHQVSDPRFFSVLSFSPKGTWLLAGTQLLHVESQSVNCDVAQKCFFTGEDTLGYLGDSQIYEIKALPRNLQVTESWPCHCIAACKSKVLTATRRPAKAKETDSKRHSRSSSAKSKEKGTSEPGKHPPSDEERGEHVEDAETSPEWGFVHEMWTSDGLKKLPLPNGFDMANTLNSHLCFSSDGRFLAGCDSSTVFVWDLNSGAVVQHNNTLTGHDIKALAFFPSKEAEVAVKLGIALTRKKGTAEENNTKGSDTTGEERFVVFSDQDIPMDPHNLFCVLNLIFGGNRGPEREGDDISSMETGGVSTPNLVAEQPIKLPLQRVDWNSVVVSPSWKSVILLTTNPNQESNITMIIDQEAHTITRVESNPSPVFIFPEVTADGLISPEILHYSFSYDSVRKHLTDKIGFPNSESRIQLFLTERILYALDLNLVLGGGLIANSCDPEININFLKEQPREEIGYFEKKLITIVKDGPWCLLLKGEVAAIATVNSTILFWQLVYPRRCVLTLGPFSGQIFSLTAAGDNMLVVVAGRDIHFIRVEPGVWRDIDVTLVHRTGHTMQPLVAAYASVQTVKGLTVESKSLLKSRAIIGALKMEREVDPSVVLAQVEKLKSVVWTSAQSKPKQMPKFLGLFFSNYSNPRGKKCTTTLREQYESLIQEQPKNTFSIIEISCDRSARLFKTNAPRDVNGWSHLQFDERELQETLVDLFDVTPCEPTIVVLNPQQGEVVAKHSLHVLFKAFAHLKFPWSVDSVKWMRFKSHKHPLELRSSPQFVCSECSEPGSGLEYHCELDSLDFHPRCTSGAYELPEWILYEGDEHPVRLDRESPRIGYTCKRCSSTFVIEVCLDSPEVEPPPKPNTPFSWSMFDGHETPLQLVFKSGSYQCGQCKKKKEQGGWVYHCPKRGLYFEPSCIGEPHGLSKWVKVEVHKHPLKLGGSQSNVLCSLCSKYFSGQNYACPVCEGEDAYLVEVECIMKQSYETLPDPVSEPNNWKKFAEHPHLLKMVFMKDFQCCQCEKPGSCWALECKVCKPEGVYFHPQCAGEPHELPKWVLESGESAHPHPLSLKSRRCEESCNKCEAIRQEQFYYCKLDKHTLHVGCCLSATELPDVEGKPLTWKKCNQDTHPVQLVLSSGEFTCHHCNKPKPGPAWAYKCHTENVFFHVECLENPQNPQKWIILNSKHKHPLQFGKAPKDLSGVCCACGDGGEGKEGGVYFCSSCHAFCHVGCSGASTPLPPMINVRTHKHPLELKEAAPPKPQGEDEDDDDNNDEEEGTDNEELRCAQCSGLIEGGQEHYYRCTKCPNMVVHVGCCTRPLPFGAKSSSGTRGVQRSNRHHHDEDDDEDENDKGQEEEEEEEENEDGGSLGAVRAKADKGKEKADHDEQRP